jgi:uncharacterized protein YeaC (DUF1315 family)
MWSVNPTKFVIESSSLRSEAMQNTELEQLIGQRNDSIEQLIDVVTPAIYINLKSAIELSKWPSGTRLSREQQDYCMQAVILYEARHIPAEERTGYDLPTGCARSPQQPMDQPSATDTIISDAETIDTASTQQKRSD